MVKKIIKIKNKYTKWYSIQENRAKFFASILIILAICTLTFFIVFDLNSDLDIPDDKKMHFELGRIITGIIFTLSYLCIIARVFLSKKKSITKLLLWLPLIISFAFFSALAIGFLFGMFKEIIDMTGFGNVEWLDFEWTCKGAFSLSYPIAIIMTFTPLFIPFDIIARIPKLAVNDWHGKLKDTIEYVNQAKSHENMQGVHDVLLLEDDIGCATVVMKFCDKNNLKCFHVTSVKEADNYLNLNHKSIKLIIADNYVRILDNSTIKTGEDWLESINEKLTNNFHKIYIVVISGHADILTKAPKYSDLILTKPWVLKTLKKFIIEKNLTTNKD